MPIHVIGLHLTCYTSYFMEEHLLLLGLIHCDTPCLNSSSFFTFYNNSDLWKAGAHPLRQCPRFVSTGSGVKGLSPPIVPSVHILSVPGLLAGVACRPQISATKLARKFKMFPPSRPVICTMQTAAPHPHRQLLLSHTPSPNTEISLPQPPGFLMFII